MKKIFSLLLFAVLFVSCSSDSKNEELLPEPSGTGMDARLIGKWKVVRADYAAPALYINSEEELEKYKKTIDYVETLGWNYHESAIRQSYSGGNSFPITGVFENGESMIEIKNDNTIDVYIGAPNLIVDTVRYSYSINDNKLYWKKYTVGSSWGINIYQLSNKNKELYIELRGNLDAGFPLQKYRASAYQKIE